MFMSSVTETLLCKRHALAAVCTLRLFLFVRIVHVLFLGGLVSKYGCDQAMLPSVLFLTVVFILGCEFFACVFKRNRPQ